MKYIELSDTEIAMIRWHMGAFEGKDNMLSLQNAMNKWPEVVAMHLADLQASYILEDRESFVEVD
jgi:hypothetical protein